MVKDHKTSKIGGAKLSGLHHDDSDWGKAESDLKDILRSLKKSLASACGSSDLSDADLSKQMASMIKDYVANLKSAYNVTMM
jgi:uncharacterized protein (DUF2252 family)